MASVVWTFDPAPKVYFGRAMPLSTLSDIIARLARLGPDYIVAVFFLTDVVQETEAGDHVILIGKVTQFEQDSAANPLLFRAENILRFCL